MVRFGNTSIVAALTYAVVCATTLSACSKTSQGSSRAAPEASSAGQVSSTETAALARFDQVLTEYATDPQDTRSRKQFRDAYSRVRHVYVRRVPEGELVKAAVEGVQKLESGPGSLDSEELVERALDAMTASLDPHSTYLNPQELRDAEVATTGRFGGLGIQVSREDGKIKIISPIEGTPAYRAGLKPGDLISAVDGKRVSDLTLSQAVHAMRGEPGTQITLKIERHNKAPFDVTITRAVIDIRPVRWSMYGSVGYVRVVNFNEKASAELAAAMQKVREELGPDAGGIVLDLRNNPGGLFNQSVRVADAFLDDGIIVAIRGRGERQIRAYRATEGDIAEGLPMVVLINSGSASASEIVASALQDQDRAIVMGTPSFGKGSVQTVIRLPQEGALKLTTALYYAPSGQSIQARGVVPDIWLTNTGEPQDLTRESDLPHALPATDEGLDSADARINVEACPALGDREDRALGCAVDLLKAGSLGAFLSKSGSPPTARVDG